jgi:hypothetical protein
MSYGAAHWALGSAIVTHYPHELFRPMAIGVLTQRARLPGFSDCQPFILMLEIIMHFIDTFPDAPIGHYFFVWLKHLRQIRCPFGEQHGTHPGDLKGSDIGEIASLQIAVRIESDLRSRQHAIEFAGPCFSLMASSDWRIIPQFLQIRSPDGNLVAEFDAKFLQKLGAFGIVTPLHEPRKRYRDGPRVGGVSNVDIDGKNII